jgi:hypothetical protein
MEVFPLTRAAISPVARRIIMPLINILKTDGKTRILIAVFTAATFL